MLKRVGARLAKVSPDPFPEKANFKEKIFSKFLSLKSAVPSLEGIFHFPFIKEMLI